MNKHLLLLAAAGLASFAAAPAQAQNTGTTRGTAPVNGAQISYTVTGASGPYLVLIHGYPLNGDLFERQRAVLSASTRVLAVDLRGFGRSTAPDSQGSIDLYANDVLALLAQLNVTKAIIGGHSMGGAIALRMYQLNPGVFQGLILNDAAAFPPPVAEQNMWSGYAQQATQTGSFMFPMQLSPSFLTGRTRATRVGLDDKLAAQIVAASVNGLIGGARALQTRQDLRPVFGTIKVPTLILEGQEDPLTPMEQAMTLHTFIPGSTLSIIPGASHGVIREAASAANQAIQQWLSANFGTPVTSAAAEPTEAD